MGCVVVTGEVSNLALKTGLTIVDAQAYIGYWQDNVYSGILDRNEQYPTEIELNRLIKKLGKREFKKYKLTNTTKNLSEVEKTFSPRVRTLRAKSIATLFQNGVTMLLEQTQEDLQDKLNDPYIGELAKAEYNRRLTTLSRVEVLKKTTPKVLFEMVRDTLKEQSEMNKEDLTDYIIEEELTGIKYYDNLTSKQRYTLASRWASARLKELPKILNNFEALAKDSLLYIQQLENVKIQLEDNDITNSTLEEEVSLDGEESIIDPEENIKEGWMNNARNISTESTLSIMVKNKLSNLVLVGKDGALQTDDIGFFMNVGLDYANGILLNTLYKMESVEDLIPMLEDLAVYHPWVNQLIKNIDAEPELASQLYRTYRKDPITYRVHRSDGSRVKTIDINKGSGITPLIESWRENTESGIIFNKDFSIYNSIGNVNTKNVAKLEKKLLDIHNKYNTYITSTREELVERANKLFEELDNIKEIGSILQAIGINVDMTDLTKVLQNNNIKEEPSYLQILSAVDKILLDIKEHVSEGDSIVDKAKKNYIKIAEVISVTMTDVIESSVRQKDKTYFSYTKPSYLTSLVKRLNNTKKNPDVVYKKWIEDNYLNTSFFMSKGTILNNWLKLLYTNEKPNIGKVFKSVGSPREIFSHRVVLELDDKSYGNWSSLDYIKVMLSEYTSTIDGLVAGYAVPILGDAQSAEFITGYRYDISDVRQRNYLKSALIDVLIQEYTRIKLVRARKEAMKSNPDIKAITNFDSSEEFLFFPEVNKLLIGNKSILELLEDSTINKLDLLGQVIEYIMDEGFKSELNEYEKMGVFERLDPNNEDSDFVNIPNLSSTNKQDAVEFLKEFYWNNKLAQSQIIQLTTTDLAYYKGAIDFQKRFKQEHSPTDKLDTNATIINKDGEKIKLGKKIETTIYLKDDVGTSNVLEEITSIIDKEVELGNMLKVDRDRIVSLFRKVNTTDAQAYRSLSSYRSLSAMTAQWSPMMEEAYQRLSNGFNIKDFNIVWQPLKPFLFTQTIKDSGVTDNEGNPILMKIPTQNKNAEYLLLAIYSSIAAQTKTGQKIKAINQFMEDNEIDVVQFESAVKVGKQGVIDINNVNSYEDTLSLLNREIRDSSGNINPDVVHQFNYEDYGISQPVPEHLLDTTQLYGTQFRKLISIDLPLDAKISIGNMTLTKKEWIGLYNAAIVNNLIDSFLNIRERFEDNYELSKFLLSEVDGNPRYSSDIAKAFTLDDNGNFQIPLYEPAQSTLIQSLMYSLIKKAITKQKIKGGAVVQVSCYGFSQDLSIKFNKDGGISALEVYMPWYTKKYLEPMLDDNGELDIENLTNEQKELLDFIGYRIPTENKYSMAPLRIKGFLPQHAGSAIMLPSEITTISGSDFDVDKLFLMLPEFKVTTLKNTELINKIIENTNIKDKEAIRITLDEIKNGTFSLSSAEDKEIYDAYKKYYKTISKVKGDLSKEIIKKEGESAEDYKYRKLIANVASMNTAERNNLILDLSRGILTHPSIAPKILTPGGFDGLKSAATVINIISNVPIAKIQKILGTKINLLNALENANEEQLDRLTKEYSSSFDPLSMLTQLYFHKQNTVGASMVGIMANAASNNAIAQGTTLEINENNRFTLNDQTLTKLGESQRADGKYISFLISEYVAAAVDNVKDPVLASLGIDLFTSDVATLLARLGHNPITIGLLLNQPIVREIVTFYNSQPFIRKEDAIATIIDKYKKSLQSKLTYGELKDTFSNSFLANELFKPTDTNQLKIALLFSRIFKVGDNLASFTNALRSDTQGGALGPTIAASKNKEWRIQDYFNNPSKILDGGDLLDTIKINEEDDVLLLNDITEGELRQTLLNSKLPIPQSFYTLGVSEPQKLMNRLFPQLRGSINIIVETLRGYTKSGTLSRKTLFNLYNDIFTYALSKTDTFNAKDKEYYLTKFPKDFDRIRRENKALDGLSLLNKLTFKPNSKYNPFPTISFSNTGNLSSLQRDRYMQDWASMLYMEDSEANKLAIDLFKYNYYKNGFSFGPNSFIHLAPIEVKLAIPEYIENLKLVGENVFNYDNFINQFIYNHLEDRTLTPSVNSKVGNFTKNNSLLEEVTINTKDNNEATRLIKSIDYINKEAYPVFFNTFTTRINGENLYYKLVGVDREFATYNRFTPINIENNYINYDYNSRAEDMSTVTIPKIEEIELGENYTRSTSGNISNVNSNIKTYESKDIVYAQEEIEVFSQPITKNSKSVIEFNLDTKKELDAKEYNRKLNNKLTTILENSGVSIGALTTLEKRLGVNGVTDFDIAKTATEGIIELIRLAEGELGQKALPEEFAHFAIQAMGNLPLVERLSQQILESGKIKEILGDRYEDYVKEYKGNNKLLAEEAIGKLLAEQLFKQQTAQDNKFKTLLNRIINAVKEFFKKIPRKDLTNALYEVNKELSSLAKDILTGNVKLSISNISSTDRFYQIEEKVSNDIRLLNQIKDRELKMLKLYKTKDGESPSLDTLLHINTLETSIRGNEIIEGINEFIQSALTELKRVEEELTTMRQDTPRDRAKIIRNMRNYLESYSASIDDVMEILSNNKLSDNRYDAKVRESIKELQYLLKEVSVIHKQESLKNVSEFLEPFIETNPALKGITKQLLTEATKDISFFDKYFDSAANSSDDMLKAIDMAIKHYRSRARLRIMDIEKSIKAAHVKLEKAGIKSTSWMYERSSSGKLTGRLLSDIDYSKYNESLKEFYLTMENKYGKQPKGQQYLEYTAEVRQWYLTNTELINGVQVPRKSLYTSKAFKSLSPAQLDYFNTYMEYKNTFEEYLPNGKTNLYKAPQVRKDTLERIKSAGFTSFGSVIKEGVKDSFNIREDDVDIFNSKVAMRDFSNNIVLTLPIYFTKDISNMDDLSTDATSGLIAYAAMAIEYDELNKVVDQFEVSRDLLQEREVAKTIGGSTLKEEFSVLNRKISNKFISKGKNTNAATKLDFLYESQLYGKTIKDEHLGKVKLTKTTDTILKITSLNSMALNLIGAISNIATGSVMNLIEAASGEFYSIKQLRKADSIYATHLPHILAESGNRIKTDKVTLYNELFNVLQDSEVRSKHADMDKRTWFSRFFNLGTLYIGQTGGEHLLQTRNALAIGLRYKLKSPNGVEVSLWDALEVTYINGDRNLGGTLKVKDGYTKLDGSKFDTSDIGNMSNLIQGVSQRLNGIYNKADSSLAQSYAAGRLLFMFRKYLIPAFEHRIGAKDYDFMTQSDREGYYRSTAKFLWQNIKDLKAGKLYIQSNWKNLSNNERANVKRTVTEMAIFWSIVAIIKLMDGSDDKEKTWAGQMLELQLRRLKTELGALTPSPQTTNDLFKILKSPTAAINTIESTIGLLECLLPTSYVDIVESGKYKGSTEAYKAFMTSPLVPMYKTIIRAIDPEDTIEFYKSNW